MTFTRHSTYPEDLNQDLEAMLHQIKVKQENFKKYTTSENQAAQMPKFIKNYVRLCHKFGIFFQR